MQFSDVQFSWQGRQSMKISMKVSMKDSHPQVHPYPQVHPQSHPQSPRQPLPCALAATAVKDATKRTASKIVHTFFILVDDCSII